MAVSHRYVTQTGAGAKNGLTWATAFDAVSFYGDLLAAPADRYYWLLGPSQSYMLTADLDASGQNGAAATPIRLVGVNVATDEPPLVSQWAIGNDRPNLLLGPKQLTLANYWMPLNLRGSTSHGDGFHVGDCCLLGNLEFEQTSGVTSAEALYGGIRCAIWDCEAFGTNAAAFRFSSYCRFRRCYAHDAKFGIWSGVDSAISDCTAAGCNSIGIYSSSGRNRIDGSLVYDCGSGFYLAGGGHLVLDNLLEANTTGAEAATEYGTDFLDGNNFHGNGTPVTNLTRGPNTTSHDPQFVDAANGDFRIRPGSLARRSGSAIILGVGASIPGRQGPIPPKEFWRQPHPTRI